MRRWSRHASALAVACSLGCNSIAGINDPVDPPTGSSGTSGTSSGGDANLQGFVGTWRNVRQITASCGDPQQETAPADLGAFALQITASGAGLVSTLVEFPSCQLRMSVSGAVATVLAGQQCTFQFSEGAVEYSYSASSTFTLTSATTAVVSITANAQLAGGADTCAYEEGSLYQKE